MVVCSLGGQRLWYFLFISDSCLDHCAFKKQRASRPDYGFHCLLELGQFLFCLLSGSRKLAALPDMNDRDSYMSVDKVATIAKLGTDDFLIHDSFGAELRQSRSSEAPEFLNQSRKFVDCLIDAILGLTLVRADLLQSVYAFCPELLLEGDDRYVFQLFAKLLRVLERSGNLSAEESGMSSEVFTTIVVDARIRHRASGKCAESIPDVVHYLLEDYSFVSRRSLCRVLKLCVLVLSRPSLRLPDVSIELSGCAVAKMCVISALHCVQSYVVSFLYRQGALF